MRGRLLIAIAITIGAAAIALLSSGRTDLTAGDEPYVAPTVEPADDGTISIPANGYAVFSPTSGTVSGLCLTGVPASGSSSTTVTSVTCAGCLARIYPNGSFAPAPESGFDRCPCTSSSSDPP